MLDFVFVLIVVCYVLVFGCLFWVFVDYLLGYTVVAISCLDCCFAGCGLRG